MERAVVHQHLLDALEKKIPKRNELIDTLMEILFMEKAAVLRRLRGDVSFSFYDVVNIAERLNLTLSHFITSKSLWVDSFIKDEESINYKIWQDFISFVQLAKKDPNSDFTDSTNLLPGTIFYKYDTLYKFYLFKYQYLLRDAENRMSFKDFSVPETILKMSHTYFQETKHFAKTTYICDNLMISNLITDIHYFSSINLMDADDLRHIKEVLLDLLDYFERIALNGCFEETGNPVDIYICDINLDTNYTHVQIHNMYISFIRAFCINTIMSRDQSSFDKIKKWVQSLIKTSTLITQSAAIFRMDYFEKQRKLVSGLHGDHST